MQTVDTTITPILLNSLFLRLRRRGMYEAGLILPVVFGGVASAADVDRVDSEEFGSAVACPEWRQDTMMKLMMSRKAFAIRLEICMLRRTSISLSILKSGCWEDFSCSRSQTINDRLGLSCESDIQVCE